jgi:uncharacterized repeat protein (TIGR03803 family)
MSHPKRLEAAPMHARKLRNVLRVAGFLAALVWATSLPADSPAQYQYTVLYGFGASGDGTLPTGRLAFDRKGNLYGATFSGGSLGGGIVFELTPGANGQWTETILHSFPDGPGDGFQAAGVIVDAAGNLYGITLSGGVNDAGTAFELSPGNNGQWMETILYNFCSLPNCTDGVASGAGMPTLGPDGTLYGITLQTAFELTPVVNGWTYTMLYRFCSLPNCADGGYLSSSLTLDARGNLFGEAKGRGLNGGACATNGCGVVYALHPEKSVPWKEVVLHAFKPSSDDGIGPWGGMALYQAALYGSTDGGGAMGCAGVGCGTVFELTRDAATSAPREQILHAFGENSAQGVTPEGGVTSDARGNLFGVTIEGGSYSCECGVVYGMKPQGNGKWAFAVLHTFAYSSGELPQFGLTVDNQGNLYGNTSAGGPNEGGVVFELSPTTQASK